MITNEEAIKYLIRPTATSTKPSAEYLKQKEAYELAVKALEEKPHAQWMADTDYESYQSCYEAYKCSDCGYKIRWRDYDKPNFCPNCGAKMNK